MSTSSGHDLCAGITYTQLHIGDITLHSKHTAVQSCPSLSSLSSSSLPSLPCLPTCGGADVLLEPPRDRRLFVKWWEVSSKCLNHDEEEFCNLGYCLYPCQVSQNMQVDKLMHHNFSSHLLSSTDGGRLHVNYWIHHMWSEATFPPRKW